MEAGRPDRGGGRGGTIGRVVGDGSWAAPGEGVDDYGQGW